MAKIKQVDLENLSNSEIKGFMHDYRDSTIVDRTNLKFDLSKYPQVIQNFLSDDDMCSLQLKANRIYKLLSIIIVNRFLAQ